MENIRKKLQNKKSFPYMGYTVLKSKLLSAFILFLSSIIIIRALPKDEYGLYVLISVFFSFFELFLSVNDASLTRFISTSGKRMQHQLVATVLSIKTLIIFLILTLFVFLYDISINILSVPSEKLLVYENLYLIMSIGFISKYIITTTITTLNAFMLYEILFRLTILNSLAILIIALFVSFYSLNIWQYVQLTTIFSFIYAIVSLYTLSREGRLSYRMIFNSINIKTIKSTLQRKIIPYSLPLFGIGLLGYIKNYLPSFILGTTASLEILASYNIFKRLTDFLHKGYDSFIQGLYPKLFKMMHSKSKVIDTLFWIGLILRIIAFVSLYFGYELIVNIYDIEESKYDYLIFSILISVFLIKYFSTFSNLIIMNDKTTFSLFKSSIMATIFSILAMYGMYEFYAIIGLILAIFMSSIFGTSLTLYYSMKIYSNTIVKISYIVIILMLMTRSIFW
jgi:O-antigen/teichoic acid export membrane protein